jgi:hypothetical protein
MSVNYTTNTLLASCIYDPPNMWRARCLVCAVLLCACTQAQNCERNEYAHETYDSFTKGRYWTCKACPRGTYGGDPGVCHPCPAFTRQLKYKKAGSTSDPGTLWCENRCENLKDNDQNRVTFRPDGNGVDDLVLMMQDTGFYACNTCAESTFKVTRSADVILTRYRHDLMDGERVGDPSKEASARDAHTIRLRHFRFTSSMVDTLAATPHLEFFQWSICASCPRGFVIDTTLSNFPCSACSVIDGVATPADATWRKCAQCTEHQYQIAESVTYEHNGLQTAVVGVLCTHCAPGSKRVSETQCRLPTECCEPCPLNYWKAENQGLCILVSPKYVPVIHQRRAFTQYVTSGATAQEPCQGGDMLMFKWYTDILIYCEDEDSCALQMASNSWRTQQRL